MKIRNEYVNFDSVMVQGAADLRRFIRDAQHSLHTPRVIEHLQVSGTACTSKWSEINQIMQLAGVACIIKANRLYLVGRVELLPVANAFAYQTRMQSCAHFDELLEDMLDRAPRDVHVYAQQERVFWKVYELYPELRLAGPALNYAHPKIKLGGLKLKLATTASNL